MQTSDQSRQSPQDVIRKVREAKQNATRLMKESGHDIGNVVTVRIDPNLPFMGYTMPLENGTYRIVVAGEAVNSGMLEGLLIHEMSHVYRMKTHHPSHNGNVIESVLDSFGKEVVKHDYQKKIIHDILNDIQDLYADDIAFKVLRRADIIPAPEVTRFLQSWLKNEPSGDDTQLGRWTDAAILIHNARAIAQMERHNVPDTGETAARTNNKFLSKIPRQMAEEFPYFRKLLGGLEENMTEPEYRRLLHDYVSHFLAIAGQGA